MSLLGSFATGMNVAVVGASGGIGAALVERLSNIDRVTTVHALDRSAGYSLSGRVWHCSIEITEEATVRNAAERVSAARPVDLVIVATGILHRGEELRPEKSIDELQASSMQQVFAANAFGPAIIAKHFLPKMRKDHKTVFAPLSARVGSIGDNRLGGWASYRASKAALNMLMKTAAIEQRRRNPESIVATLHPGTVDTRLSRPFQDRVPKGKLFTPEVAADRLLRVIDNLTQADTGGFYAWDGSAIEY